MENNLLYEEDTQHGRFLTFNLVSELFGLEIKHVTEIVGIQPITRIPEACDYVRGVINLRGKIIPVVDMRLKFNMEPMSYNDRTCIVVVDIQEISVGLIVDNVSEVLTLEDSSIVPPPNHKTGAHNRYIKAIGKVGNEVILLLDSEELFNDTELDTIEDVG